MVSAKKTQIVKTDMPTVNVEIPNIQLKIEDLAYLRGLTPGGARCACTGKSRDKLIFLGLAAMGTVEPTEAEIKFWDEVVVKVVVNVRKALKEKAFESLYDATYPLHRYSKPKAKTDLILTEAGKKLLKEGRAASTISRNGCA